MLKKLSDTEIGREFSIALSDKEHPLHKIAKSIAKKDMDSYLKILFRNFQDEYRVDSWRMEENAKSFFQEFFNTGTAYERDEKKDDEASGIETFAFGNETLGVLLKHDKMFLVEGCGTASLRRSYYAFLPRMTNGIKYVRDFPLEGRSFYSRSPDGAYLGNLGSQIPKTLTHMLFDHEYSLFRFVSTQYAKAFYRAVGDSMAHGSDVVEYLKSIGLDADALDFFGTKISDVTVSPGELYDIAETLPGTDRRNAETYCSRFPVLAKKVSGKLYGEEDESTVIDNLRLVDFFNYYEALGLFSVRYEDFFDFVESEAKEPSRPDIMLNSNYRKFSKNNPVNALTENLLVKFQTYCFYEDVPADSPIDIAPSGKYVNGSSQMAMGKTFTRGIGLVNYDDLRTHAMRDRMCEFMAPMVDSYLKDFYGIKSLAEMRTKVCDIQYAEAYGYAVVSGLVSEETFRELVYECQGSYLIAESMSFSNAGTKISLADGTSFVINKSDLNISNSYTNGIGTTKNGDAIVMSGRMKISHLEFHPDGRVSMALSNRPFTFETETVRLGIL